ncbi:putative nuclease HARBI1 isoform X1 [Ixodes scapularis]
MGTQDSLKFLYEDVMANKNQQDSRLVVALDIKKALDAVLYWAAIKGVRRCGIQGKCLAFIQDFLRARRFQVKIGNTKGPGTPNCRGVPQGAVISPALFNMAVSGTPRCIRAPGGDLSEAIPPAQDRGAVVVRRTSRGTGGEESAYHVMTVELQVLCALRFYGTGSFQGMVASDEHVARDQKTVSVAVRAVSVAIVRRLGVQRGWIHFPETPSERFDAEKGFRLLGRIPGVIGCVDGTMVSIVGPSKNDPTITKAAYWCRKYFYALNVMVVTTLMLRCQNPPQICRKKKYCRYGLSMLFYDCGLWGLTTARACALRSM